MNNEFVIRELREKLFKELNLYAEDSIAREKIIASFIEFFLLKMIKKIVVEKHAFYDDIKSDTYDDLAGLFCSLYGKEAYINFFENCLLEFKKGLE